MKKNVVLIGMMGCGKTTVGKVLAKKLGKILADTDKLIEFQFSMKVSEIFEKMGEQFFREIESRMAQNASDFCNVVVATGGGIVLKEENMTALKENGIVVFLNASAEEIFSHISKSNSRPLLKEMSVDTIDAILKKRLHLYEKYADFVVETKDKTPSKIAKEILLKLV